MTDQEHAAAIKEATKRLNEAILAAKKAGLKVSVEQTYVAQIGDMERPYIHTIVDRPILAS